MAQKKISRRKQKRKPKNNPLNGISTTHVPLCALGEVIKDKQILAPIHHLVEINHNSVAYRPTDKLVLATKLLYKPS